ncbi:hypothetical protein, partial [Bilophila wadsworthia]|uniref:hypothetical protein n=1 Tax=Bilophila wadsworthia TaxID=35833 RepID=UPI003AAA3189
SRILLLIVITVYCNKVLPSVDIGFMLASTIDISNCGSSSTAKRVKARQPEREHFEDTDKRPGGLRPQI